MNFLVSIVTSPRKTIRTLLESEPRRGLYLLPAIMGIISAPTVASSVLAVTDGHEPEIWIGSFVLSVLSFWMYVSVYGAVYRWVGGWFGGAGTNEDARLALAWTQVPFIVIGAVHLPFLFVYREQLYPEVDLQSITSLITLLEDSGGAYWVGTVFLIPKFGGYVISLKILGEALGFSAWKAFGVKLIAILLHIPLFFVAGLIAVPLSIGWLLLTSA